MPAIDTGHGSGFAPTNGGLRKEIQRDILDELGSIEELKRTTDSIKITDNFHMDARELDNNFKVEIQYRRGAKTTVAVALVNPGATVLQDFINAIRGSLQSGTVWEVT